MKNITDALKQKNLYSDNNFIKIIEHLNKNSIIDEIIESGQIYAKNIKPFNPCSKFKIGSFTITYNLHNHIKLIE